MEQETILPRRFDQSQWNEAEKAIYNALQEIEKMPGHPLLTEAGLFLDRAAQKVGDYIQTV